MQFKNCIEIEKLASSNQLEGKTALTMQHSTDERGMRGINKEHPDHVLSSHNCKIQVYFSLASQLRWNTQKPQCVS